MGCKEAFPLAKKSAHERDCPFLQLKCPFHGQCAFNGALADVVPHLAAEHQVAKATPKSPKSLILGLMQYNPNWYINTPPFQGDPGARPARRHPLLPRQKLLPPQRVDAHLLVGRQERRQPLPLHRPPRSLLHRRQDRELQPPRRARAVHRAGLDGVQVRLQGELEGTNAFCERGSIVFEPQLNITFKLRINQVTEGELFFR